MHKYIYALILLASVCVLLYVGLTAKQQQQWIDAGAIQRDPITNELHFVPCEVGI